MSRRELAFGGTTEQVTNNITHLCSTSPYKPQERSGLIVESLWSHPVTPPDSADTSLSSQGEAEEPVERHVRQMCQMCQMLRIQLC